MSKIRTIDMEQGANGVFAEVAKNKIEKSKSKNRILKAHIIKYQVQPIPDNPIDDFIQGVDVVLDFVDYMRLKL